ncbi:MAG: amino acid racemase [Spirochaetales bacterium]|nr:amino acid racemase [Spirochaetales bacterium]
MAKHIGIAACSAEGAALCYTTICTEAQNKMGKYMHPEVTMHSHPFAEYMKYIYASDWDSVAELMASSAEKLARTGADFVICPDNTIHQAFKKAVKLSSIPWLHIAEAAAEKALEIGSRCVGILGTKYLMTGPVYPDTFKKYRLNYRIPEQEDRERINTIIFDQLVNGILREESRVYFNSVIGKLKDKGCDSVVLGCTEIPLLVDPKSSPLPTLDSTRLLAGKAITEAIKPD